MICASRTQFDLSFYQSGTHYWVDLLPMEYMYMCSNRKIVAVKWHESPYCTSAVLVSAVIHSICKVFQAIITVARLFSLQFG